MMKRKGLFGSPGTTAFAEMVQGVGEPRAMTTQPVDVMQAPPVEKKPGFFGNGGVGWQIMGSIGDALREANGLEASYGPSMMLQRQQQLAAQRQQQERDYEWQDWQRKQEWEATHKVATPTEQQRNFQMYQQMTPAERALFDRMRAGDPYVNTTLPNKQFYSGPASGIPSALGLGGAGNSTDDQPFEEDGYVYTPGPGGRGNEANWKPKGGSGGNVGGGFRAGY